jgi:hypothetical protein
MKQAKSPETPAAERRRQQRIPASGQVRLQCEDLLSVAFQGTLVDLSAGGFRAVHQCRGLSPGQFVRFAHPTASGRARVVWNRIAGEQVESGFLIAPAGGL